MSEDNWAICPRCLKKANQDNEKMLEELEGLKDTITPSLYEKLMEEDPLDLEKLRTLREDYEFWMDRQTGVLDIRYAARCSTCEFKHEYKAESQAKV